MVTGIVVDRPDAERARGRAVVVSTSTQLAARVVHLSLNVVSTLAVVRYLTPDAYGTYVVVLSTTLLAGLVADFGLAKLGVREISRGHDEHEVVGTVFGLRLGLAVAAAAFAQVALVALGASAEVHGAAAVASLLYLGDAGLAAAVIVFHVRIRQQYEALVRMGMELVETAVVLALIARGASLPWLFAPPAATAGAGALVALVVARRRFGTRPRFSRRLVGHLVREALPLGPALVLGVLYLKLDGLLLAALRPSREVGLYGAVHQPVEYLLLGTAVIINVVFPLLAEAGGRGDQAAFARLYQSGTEALVAVTLAVPVALAFTAPGLVVAVFGGDYEAAAGPLRILAVALVLMTVNAWQSFVLLAGGLQHLTLRYDAVAVGLAAVLCLVGIALAGMAGAALATAATAVFVLGASTAAVRRRLGCRLDVARLAGMAGAGAGGLLAGAAVSAAGASWAVVGPVAVAAYAAAVVPVLFLARPAIGPEVTR
jgi:O-antigen/teichoic acid export membrane protein